MADVLQPLLDELRAIRERVGDRTDWFPKASHAGSMDLAFAELRRLVERDVARANQAFHHAERADSWEVVGATPTRITVAREHPTGTDEWVVFGRTSSQLEVWAAKGVFRADDGDGFAVDRRWSAEDRAYRLETKDGTPVELWEIVRRALIPLFFR